MLKFEYNFGTIFVNIAFSALFEYTWKISKQAFKKFRTTKLPLGRLWKINENAYFRVYKVLKCTKSDPLKVQSSALERMLL